MPKPRSLKLNSRRSAAARRNGPTHGKKYYSPLKIGERLTVVPAWDKEYRPEPGDLTVRMDPGMAFGSGTHESTRLCARLLERFMKPGALVLDVGTGSGILAIAASLLGASHVDACDLDPVAVRVARDNIMANGVSNARVFQSDLLQRCSARQNMILSVQTSLPI